MSYALYDVEIFRELLFKDIRGGMRLFFINFILTNILFMLILVIILLLIIACKLLRLPLLNSINLVVFINTVLVITIFFVTLILFLALLYYGLFFLFNHILTAYFTLLDDILFGTFINFGCRSLMIMIATGHRSFFHLFLGFT